MVARWAADTEGDDVSDRPEPREPSALGELGGTRRTSPTNPKKETEVSKWTALKNSAIVKVSASAGTLVAVAVVVGAGFKWN